jgi:hypothetical protein
VFCDVTRGHQHVFDLQADPSLQTDLGDSAPEAADLAWSPIVADAGGRPSDYSKTKRIDAIGEQPAN